MLQQNKQGFVEDGIGKKNKQKEALTCLKRKVKIFLPIFNKCQKFVSYNQVEMKDLYVLDG